MLLDSTSYKYGLHRTRGVHLVHTHLLSLYCFNCSNEDVQLVKYNFTSVMQIQNLQRNRNPEEHVYGNTSLGI